MRSVGDERCDTAGSAVRSARHGAMTGVLKRLEVCELCSCFGTEARREYSSTGGHEARATRAFAGGRPVVHPHWIETNSRAA